VERSEVEDLQDEQVEGAQEQVGLGRWGHGRSPTDGL
jgi:hypothetical protein